MKAVFFDIGETLINETRQWSLFADWLGIPRMTMFGILGGLIAQGRDHRDLFTILRPETSPQETIRKFRAEVSEGFIPEDLYPDVIAALTTLRQRSVFVGIAGNQPAERLQDLIRMEVPADLIATSAGWKVSKPSPEFFTRIMSETGFRADEIAYVGDRVDNDVVPAAAAGMVAVHIVRGPWGYLQRNWPGIGQARWQIQSLAELPALLASDKKDLDPC
jgi:FMN phosphatase YigB (HAD superfamily)